jgi:ketosteroid isomerase-like protein
MSDSDISTPQPAGRFTAVFDQLLKQPVATLRQVKASGQLRQTWVLAAGALLAFLLYGLVAGSFQGGSQMAVAAWKAPVIVVLSALLCAPSLFVFASLLGASLTPRTLFTVLAGFCAFLGVLLVGLVPIAWLFSASSRSLVFVTWLHVFLWLSAVVLAGRYLRAVLAEAGGRGIIVPWLLLFTVVSFQVVTLLRPVLWRAPSDPLLESRSEKLSFFEHLGRTYAFDNPPPPLLPDRPTTLSRILEAERARSADAASGGVAGLLRHVADDALTFSPAPVSAKALWQANVAASPAAPGTTREPRTGDVSGSRDLAWVMGNVQARGADGTTRHGCYLSLWRANDDRWRQVLDIDVGMANPCPFDGSGFTPADDSIASMQWREAAQESLKQSDLRVSRLTAEQGLTTGLGSVLREDARLVRPGLPPITGRADARTHLAAAGDRPQFTPFGVVVSRDGSLGYTYGRVERVRDGVTSTAYYVRVWRAWPSGEYAVVIDVETAAR